jgi:hypothetical protein
VTSDRESSVADAFVSIAGGLVDGFGVVEILSGLTADCVRLLGVESAGLLLADSRGVLHVMAASSERTRNLELLQLQRDEGPCLDCFHRGEAVSAADFSLAEERWPTFAPAALAAGFASVDALPMRLRDNVLGAIGLFGSSTGTLSTENLRLGQALADVASIAVVADKIAADNAVITQQLQLALTSRVVVEQSKGLLAQLGDLDMAGAFVALRRYARDHNLRLSAVADSLVSRDLAGEAVLAYAMASGLIPPGAPEIDRN